MRCVLAIALACAAAPAAADSTAQARDRPDLTLRGEPPPRDLHMRRRTAQVPAPAARRPHTPMPAAPNVSATSPEPIPGLEGIRDVRDPISFSINVGYQIDAARPSGRRALGAPPGPARLGNGVLVRPGVDYERLRSYAFGEAFVSTRGIGLPSLSTYFSLRFQGARKLTVDRDALLAGIDPDVPRDAVLAAPIATWFERSGPEVRTGWAELSDFLPRRWGLRKLRVRVGDQYVYGPWILHLGPGVNFSYDGPTISTSFFGGLRRSDYTREQDPNRPGAFGASLRFDLRGLTTKVPIALAGEYLRLSDSTATAQPLSESAQLQLDWRPRRDIVVLGQLRGLAVDQGPWRMANQRFEVRVRYKDVTNFVFSGMRRLDTDWRWDPTLVERRQDDPTEARRYLDLGPVLPQTLFAARAGTLIAENIDLFARFAASSTGLVEDDVIASSYAAPYLEAGTALEIRLRRQIAFGASVLTRSTERILPPDGPVLDQRNSIEPLPTSGSIGEDAFTEVGATVRLTLGARRFSALIEVYGRQTTYTPTYADPILPLPESDRRGGGRFTVDAWVGRRFKLFASYDVSSALDTAPELTGYKSLRLIATGVY